MKYEYPRLVAVETTNRCNAKCSFCPNSDLNRGRLLMGDELFRKIIDDCTEFPLPAIEPFLQGEPFVDPKIFDRLQYINEKLPDTALRLYSNGAALNQEKADRLRSLNVDKLYISLNTIVPERYGRIVGLSFEHTMAHVEYLATPNGKGTVAREIIFRLTLTDESTKKELSDFKKLCKRLRARPMAVGLFNYKGDIQSDLPVPSYPCEHIDRLDILSSGKTTLCCMDQEGEYGWGSVEEASVLEVFNNKLATQLRMSHRQGKRKNVEPCNRCNLFWPSFSGMHAGKKIINGIGFLWYFARHRPQHPAKRGRRL